MYNGIIDNSKKLLKPHLPKDVEMKVREYFPTYSDVT